MGTNLVICGILSGVDNVDKVGIAWVTDKEAVCKFNPVVDDLGDDNKETDFVTTVFDTEGLLLEVIAGLRCIPGWFKSSGSTCVSGSKLLYLKHFPIASFKTSVYV